MNNSTSSQDIPVSPLNPKSAEWVQLHNTVEMLRIELSDKLQETARIMHAWESRLIDEQEEYRDMNRHLTMMDKRREERRARIEAEEKARYESSLESISKEKDAEILRLQEEINAKNKSIIRLNSKISELQILISKIEHLSQIVETRFDIHTADADVILESISNKFCDYEKQIQTLKEDLLNRPTHSEVSSLKGEFEKLQTEITELRQQNEKLLVNQGIMNSTISEKMTLEDKNAHLQASYDVLRVQYNRLTDEIKTLRNIYQNASERDARVRNIEIPCLRFDAEPRTNPETNEIKWLNNISHKCAEYGLTFLDRILKSFHTSLKTAEWSPITVLAGVSGTGKSELPRLYSYFGGINFLNLSVQSNWDCQESMLGYFNTIENFFDAQPVLRLLAQSQKAWDDNGQGLKDFMTLVLMDEMNLAHVELYFAEFLSKLEQRRGCSDHQVPTLSVKLGANIEPYLLPLGRNVLWTGTMNQDETTKSLSDKVLDRSIVINFPRPTKLHSRKKLSALPENQGLLPRTTWEKWLNDAEEIPSNFLNEYKERIEQINECLSISGRAIGHRVWQSIQNYMMNYPTVIASRGDDTEYKKALNIAFEDQLVQKIMPKLRGIETSGNFATKCLNPIRQILDEHHPSLLDDFDYARDSGYGQFIWNSAYYLTKD